MLIMEDVQDLFHRTITQGFMTEQDCIDTGGALKSQKTKYKVIDQLRGESKKRWLKKFGNC